jgi:hypothetical protein
MLCHEQEASLGMGEEDWEDVRTLLRIKEITKEQGTLL